MKLNKYFLLLLTVLFVVGCDFAEKNIDPNSSTTIEPGPLLTYSQFYTNNQGLAKRTQVGLCMMYVQQTASLERDEMSGDKYLETESQGVFFTDTYSAGIKNIQELLNRTEGDDALVNTYAVGLIWRSFLIHRITDLYGDVPYSEAGNGYVTQVFYPKYDAQKDIYAGIIKDIEDALAMLDASHADQVKGDIIYKGDVEKWKRFGNSLLLRLGMRMEKSALAEAKSVVSRAIENGVMQNTDDICMVQYITGKSSTENPLSTVFKGHGLINSGSVKISNTFMKQLKRTNDPRLSVYSALPNGNTDPALQNGLPNGYDILSIFEGEPGYTSLADYSNFNPETILQLDAPVFFLTHAEVELLKAEAILKGWVAGDAEACYERAVRSSMEQQAYYGSKGVIDEEQINSFLDQKLFANAPTVESKLNVLGTEFWVATFINGYESYANWRRTGYPILFPVSFAGSPNKGNTPRRFSYPTDEYSVNREHVNEAIERQGADNLSTRIWWDKE